MLDLTRIKNIREDNDLSQREVANILNVSRSTYSLWELVINIIPLSSLYKLSSYFDVSIDYLLGGKNKFKKHSDGFDLKKLGYNIN